MAAGSADTFELIEQGLVSFGAKVRAVPAARWSHNSPCSQWSVRDVVNHVTSEQLWAPHLLAGETIEQVGDRYDGDVLGDSPSAAWELASVQSRDAWRQTPTHRVVHLSFGDTPAVEYGEQMLVDLVIHGWDLARGAGLDETIEPMVAVHVLDYLVVHARQWQQAGVFAESVRLAVDDPASRLLGLAGRRP